MGDPSKVTAGMQKSEFEWATFRAVCRDNYQLDPEKDGVITAAEKLTSGKDAWAEVWMRYKDAPRSLSRYKRATGIHDAKRPF